MNRFGVELAVFAYADRMRAERPTKRAVQTPAIRLSKMRRVAIEELQSRSMTVAAALRDAELLVTERPAHIKSDFAGLLPY